MKNTRINLQLGTRIFRVELDQYTSSKAYELFDKVAEIRIKNSPYAKFPKLEGEADDLWRERIAKESETDKLRKDGEDTEKYLKRVFDAKLEMYELSFSILNAIAEVFNQSKVTEDEFKQGGWLGIKEFVFKVLNLGDIPCNDFYVDSEALTK